MNNKINVLTYSGLMAAITFIGTSILAFPVSFTNGYIHLGDGFVLLSGIILGKRNGALAAGIGSALADIYLGYASWALPTFIIKALMAFLIGYAFEQTHSKSHRIFAYTASGVLMVSLYYATYGIMYGNWIAPVFSIPSNILQYVVGVAISVALLPLAMKFRNRLGKGALIAKN